MSKRNPRDYPALVYSPTEPDRNKVRRQYRDWRREHKLPDRCDNSGCVFYTQPLVWNAKPLPLVLDHVDGNKFDNRPEMLRYLCANCDSQLATRGGGNRNRIRGRHEQGFRIVERDGRTAYTYFGSGGLRSGGSAETKFVPSGSRTSPESESNDPVGPPEPGEPDPAD